MTKLLLTGDLHLTDKCPENRVDDYQDTVLRKFRFLFEVAKERGCDFIIQPGDFSDSPGLSYEMFVKVISIIKDNHIPIITTWGQHDLRYRSRSNTFLSAMERACNYLHIVTLEKGLEFSGLDIYASAWEEEVPLISSGSNFKVLVTHRMVVDEKLWQGQEGYQNASPFLRSTRFDLIVSGDNHKRFFYSTGKRFLFNQGSLLRSNISQVGHRPSVIVFDIDSISYQEVFVPIEEPEKVFRMEKVMKDKERNEELDAFVSGLSEHKEMGLSFSDDLSNYLKVNGIKDSIKNIIEECKNG
jgi:DNA repair exonuclease SbcCD nuclease subunit